MRKVCLCLLSALLTSICLTAQTLGTAPNGVFTADDIEYWVGNGSNETALVLVFNDGKTPQALVYGYRYDGTKSLQQMCADIAAADPRFFYQEGSSSGTVNGFGIDMNGNGIFTLQNPDNPTQTVDPTTNVIPTNTDVDGFTPAEAEDRWQSGFGFPGYWYVSTGGWYMSVGGWTTVCWLGDGETYTETNATYAAVPDPNSSCPSLKGFHATTVSQNVASVIWNAHTVATNYQIEIKPASQTDWATAISDNVSDTFYNFTGLVANTVYNCRVKALCGSEDESSWSSVSFRTLCDAVTELPYIDNFDSYGNGTSVFPTCWTKVVNNTSMSNALYVSTNQHSSGTSSLFFQSPSANAELIAIAPYFDESIDINGLNVVFQLRYPQLANGMIVGVVENDGTFVGIDTVYNTISNTWQRQEVSLASYSGDGGRIALKGCFVSTARNIFVDDVTIDYIPTCQTLNNLHLTDTAHNQVTIEWNDPNGAGNYLVEVSTSASDWTNALSYSSTTTTCTATGLNPNTWYTYRVKAICSSTDESVWASGRFKTVCGAIGTLPYEEDFDDYSYGDDYYVECWTKDGLGTGDKINISNSSSASGSRCLYLYSNRSNGFNAAAVLPSFETEVNLLGVQFKMKNPDMQNGLIVGVLEEGGFVAIDTVYSTATGVWQDRETSFTSYSGDGGQIAFRPYTTTTHLSSFAIYLDDIKVDYAPACTRPQDLVVTMGTNGTSVDLAWTDEANSQWVVYYKAADEAEYTVAPLTANPSSLGGLTLRTDYTFQIASVCTSGDTVRAVATVDYSTPCYENVISDFPYTDGFENGIDCWTSVSSSTSSNNRWQVETIGTRPSCSPSEGSKMLFYDSYNVQRNNSTAIISPAVNISQAMEVSFDLYHDAGASSNRDRVVLYVNSLPTLENATVVDTVLRYSSTNGWQEHVFPLPAEATGRQYIIIQAVSDYGNNIYLDNFKLAFPPTCVAVNDLSATALVDEASIFWTDPNEAGNYLVEVSTSASDWTNALSYSLTTTTCTATGLNPNTWYVYRVKAICSSTDESVWVSGRFKTDCGAIAELPYSENFDSYYYGDTIYANCWAKHGLGTGDKINVSNSSSASGSRCLYLYSNRANSFNAAAVLPSFDEELGLLNLQFKLKSLNNAYGVVVGVLENENFVAIDTVLSNVTGAWLQKEVSLTSYNGEGGRIAFKPYTSSESVSNVTLYLDDIKVDYAPACTRPQDFVVTMGTSADEVNLAWTDEENSQWVVYYKAADEEEYTVAPLTANPSSLGGLTLRTDYTFQIASVCTSGDTVRALFSVDYTTPMEVETLPYEDSFTTASSNAWYLKNGTSVNKWCVGTPSSRPDGALYISKDNGATVGYNNSSASVVIAEKLFNTGTSDSLTISFDLTIGGEGSYDYLKVFWVPVDTNFQIRGSSSVPYFANSAYSNGILVKNETKNYLSEISGTRSISVSVANEPNSLKKLVFLWKNDGSQGDNPAVIENLSIEGTGDSPVEPCDAPTALAVSNITETTAEVSWNGSASSYEVRLNGGAAETVTTTSKTLSGLTAGTAYTVEVRAVCESSNSAWVSTNFTTANAEVIAPSVATLAATDITQDGATLHGTVTAGSETIDAQGFEYKAQGEAEWENMAASGESMSAELSGLTAATTYEYRAYARTASGNHYGDIMSFTTQQSSSLAEATSRAITAVIYPNPAKDKAVLKMSGITAEATLIISDMQGRILATETIAAGSKRYELNTSNYASGVYYIRIVVGNTVNTQKLIVE